MMMTVIRTLRAFLVLSACTSVSLRAPTTHARPAIYAISDLHTDRVENMEWLRSELPWPADASNACAVVAGDVSHRLDVLEETLATLADRFARVFFVPGNHELWCSTQPLADSLQKCDAVLALCAKLGVETEPARVGAVQVVPLLSWYDRSLALPARALGGAPPLPLRLWADYGRCRWPDRLGPADGAAGERDEAVAAHFAALNQPRIREAQRQMAAAAARGEGARGLLSLTHFLPAHCCLPDWCEPEAAELSLSWLSHGAARKAALFASVAGSARYDAQLRSIAPASEHVHVFGHSHRPKDFTKGGVRYVHNPLGKGTERRWGALPERPEFVRLWDEHGRPVPARRTIIRYWEEVGRVSPRLAR